MRGFWITEEPSDGPRGFTASTVCGLTLVTVTPIGALGGGVVGTVVGLATNRFTPIPLPTNGLGMLGSAAGPLSLTLGVRDLRSPGPIRFLAKTRKVEPTSILAAR